MQTNLFQTSYNFKEGPCFLCSEKLQRVLDLSGNATLQYFCNTFWKIMALKNARNFLHNFLFMFLLWKPLQTPYTQTICVTCFFWDKKIKNKCHCYLWCAMASESSSKQYQRAFAIKNFKGPHMGKIKLRWLLETIIRPLTKSMEPWTSMIRR